MRAAPVLWIDVPAAARLAHSLAAYGHFERDDLGHAVSRVAKRLGGARLAETLACLANGDIAKAAAIMLEYYDASYDHAVARRGPTQWRIALPTTDARDNAAAVLAMLGPG